MSPIQHFYCYSTKLVSLEELEQKAIAISTGAVGDSVTIHLHPYGRMCSEYEHEMFMQRAAPVRSVVEVAPL